MTINYNELKELLAAIAGTDISELILKSEEFELTIRKGGGVSPVAGSVPVASVPALLEVAPIPVAPVVPPSQPSIAEPTATAIDKKWVAIASPMVGTFYRAPAPNEPPFVSVNERIRVGQPVCIIEAMKLMNEIEAEIAGQIVEIAVENGQPVEFGQTLMWVNPE